MISAKIQGHHIVLGGNTYEYHEYLGWIPSAVWKRGRWALPATPSAAYDLGTTLANDLEVSDDVKTLFLLAELDSENLESNRDFSKLRSPGNGLWLHQAGMHGAFAASERGLMYCGMGSGKTRVAFEISNHESLILVICPKNAVATVWPGEMSKHGFDFDMMCLTSDRIERDPGWPDSVDVCSGSVKKKASALATFLDGSNERPRIVVLNYESMWRGPLGKLLLSTPWDICIADEIQKIKSPTGRASKFMWKLGRVAKRRFGMSGTPCPHSPLDAFGVYRFIDAGIFGESWVRFRARYAIMANPHVPQQVTGYQNEDDLRKRFYSICYRVKSEEVLDLPECHHVIREFDLPGNAARIYRDLGEEYMAWLESGEEVTAQNALDRLLKLAEVACGHVIYRDEDDPKTPITKELHAARLDLLVDIFEEIETDEPVVVFYRFRHDRNQVLEAAKKSGRDVLDLSAGQSALNTWQKSSSGEVFSAQMQSGSEAIDLTRAKYCVYYSHGWSLGHYEQSLARTHRPGQGRSVVYAHLAARGTIDQRLIHSHQEKKRLIEEILVDPRYLQRKTT